MAIKYTAMPLPVFAKKFVCCQEKQKIVYLFFKKF